MRGINIIGGLYFMKRQAQGRKRLLSIVLFVFMTFNLLSPIALATEVPKKAVAKPLVIMMEYKDYKFSDIDTKETDWRLRGIPGAEYTPGFVQELLFGESYYTGEEGQQFMSVRKYFNEITAGSYSFEGNVVGPYTAKEIASFYGSDRNNDGSDQDEAMLLVREAIQAVANDPNVDLSEYDVENRTGDGEFGVPDGVIDTVIVVHPGLGEEWGGGSLEDAAIWPFRCGFSWYDENNNELEKAVDTKSKEWKFDDFVIIAQDSASDMLIHEYGHVLGLPDLYGFSGSNPPVEWWCIMGGSYTGKEIAGTMPNSYGAYSREFLQNSFIKKGVDKPNWAYTETEDFTDIDENGLDLELNQAHERTEGKTDLFRMDLPNKETIITVPSSGDYAYFSGNDNDMRSWMKTTIDLTDYAKAKLQFKAWYKIDPYFDFATVRVNESGSTTFSAIQGNITTTKFDDWLMDNETEEQRLERNPGHGITDDSKGWVDAEFDLSNYAGKKIDLKFYFWTDGNTPEKGIYIDDIAVSGISAESFDPANPEANYTDIKTDDAEGDSIFDLSGGFSKSTGKINSEHYYLLEWRNVQEGKIDEGLAHVYYGWPEIGYDPGLLVWYVNKMYANSYYGKPDQQVKDHPGECFAGVVDADQNPVGYDYKDGKYYDDKRVDFNMHDAAFSLRMENKFTHNWGGGTVTKEISPYMVPDFDDSKDYTNPSNTQSGLNLPSYGIKILVTEEAKDRSSAKIHILNSSLNNKPVDYSDGLNVKKISVKGNNLELQVENDDSDDDDDLGDKAYISYIKKNTDGTVVEAKEELLLIKGVYKCSVDFLKNIEKGIYKVNFVVLEDEDGNARAIYNSEVHSGYGMDLSSGDIDNRKLTKPFNIKEIKTIDMNGEDKTKFSKGDTVLVNVKLEASEEINNAIVIIDVQDSKGVHCALRYAPYNNQISEYSLGFSTNDFKKGQSKVNVYILDNLNSKNPLSETGTFTFTIK